MACGSENMRCVMGVVAVLAAACTESEVDDQQSDASMREVALAHMFPMQTIPVGWEDADQCQSWTLDNDEPFWVHEVVASNQGGLHHSNWVFVPDDLYDGPDGIWPCAERGFDQVAASSKGGVFFAQSTQSPIDAQRFPEGAAFLVPARSRIVGQVHVLNVTDKPISTRLGFEVFTLPEDEVTIPLRAMAYTNLALDLPPKKVTRARMECAVPQPAFGVYYVMPHYHSLGSTLTVSIVGGARDGDEVFRADARYGDPLSKVFDPPVRIQGADKLRIECEYDNPRDERVAYGIGKQEMCVVLIYADIDEQAGGVAPVEVSTTEVDGVHVAEASCATFSASQLK